VTITLVNPIAARVVQVLTDFLPAELDLIDTAQADGITTPDIARFYQHETPVVVTFPSVRIRIAQSDPVEVFTTAMGNKAALDHQIVVIADATLDTGDDDRLKLERLAMRYAAGIFTVLVIKHDGLDTTADPVRWAQTTKPGGSISYGPEAVQQDGTKTRSATVPLAVMRSETG